MNFEFQVMVGFRLVCIECMDFFCEYFRKCEDHQRWDRRDRKVHFSLFHSHEGGASLPNLGNETKHIVVVAMVMATVHTNIVSHFDGRLLLDENNKIKTEI